MYLQEFRHARHLYISKVNNFGPFSGHHQTYIPEPIRYTIQSRVYSLESSFPLRELIKLIKIYVVSGNNAK